MTSCAYHTVALARHRHQYEYVCTASCCSFDPSYTPNITDFEGRRYCYRNQPEACQWNCVMLANALFSAGLLGKEEAEEALGTYAEVSQA